MQGIVNLASYFAHIGFADALDPSLFSLAIHFLHP